MSLKGLKTLITGLLMLTVVSMILASDTEANTDFSAGRDKEKHGSYRKAASKYMDAHFIADSSVLKGNALIAAARAYRKAELYGDEFDCLTKLLREHLAEVDFSYITNRIYKIGDLYFAGHRDLFVTWLPFIKKDDRTFEIYEAALKLAPCSEPAAQTRLRLARMYIDEQKPDDAIRHLREVSNLHPGTPSAKYALLELCSLLLQMSERGDGDHAYSKQGLEACTQFLTEYPKAKEEQWVYRARQTIRNRMAARIHSVGRYYYRSGKPELAEKYLADVVKNYPNTEIAPKSEEMLANIDKEFSVAGRLKNRYLEVKERLVMKNIPEDDQPIMIVPEDSNNKWLLPVRNLKKSAAIQPSEYINRKAYSLKNNEDDAK